MNFLNTVEQSLLLGFYPAGWDMERIDKCCSNSIDHVQDRQKFWNPQFQTVCCEDGQVLEMKTGHEIANEIRQAAVDGHKLVLMLPVYPERMFSWAVYFLTVWRQSCSHVHCFNTYEWSDKDGYTVNEQFSTSFATIMNNYFHKPLGELAPPPEQRNYATQRNLSKYQKKIAQLKDDGAKVVLVTGIGRMMNIAFWEPQFASEFASEDEYMAQAYRKGAKLHPISVELSAMTHFESRTTNVSCFANTIGPAIFMQTDYVIAGCGGESKGGAMVLWTTLRYGPSVWIPSTYIPTMPGKLFYSNDMIGLK
jgi:glucosamine-6-phosphate deaminase